jgi:[ribosomal protein S18]-alanine N-acetyltransferase
LFFCENKNRNEKNLYLCDRNGFFYFSILIMPIIRAYITADKADCLAAFRSNVPKFFVEEECADFEDFLERYAQKESNPAMMQKTDYFVMEKNKQIIACGGFGYKDEVSELTLAWGLVHRDFHKKGFGEQLLVFRLAKIEEMYPETAVFVDTTQFSYGFYERFGFVTTKITNDFYEQGMHRYDMRYEVEGRR